MSRLKFWITAGRNIKFNYAILIHSGYIYIYIYYLYSVCLMLVPPVGPPKV